MMLATFLLSGNYLNYGVNNYVKNRMYFKNTDKIVYYTNSRKGRKNILITLRKISLLKR